MRKWPDSCNNESRDDESLLLSDEEMRRIRAVMEKMLEMGIAAVYGEEDTAVPDADVDCESRLGRCRAKCCTFTFALTKEEVKKGHVIHNPERPFFIKREEDGYCPHLERSSLQCGIWEDRPLRCRRYDCTEDPQVWPDGRFQPRGKSL